MNASRLAAWIFGLAVCTAWLASAAGVGRTPPVVRVVPQPPVSTELAALAADVQTQAARLKERLSQAPAPSAQGRNPFSFAERPRAAVRPPRAPAVMAPVMVSDPLPAEAVLVLIGIAEMAGPAGPVRTAMITRGGELLMVTTGELLLARYEVASIGPDTVQLKDRTSGESRSLTLR